MSRMACSTHGSRALTVSVSRPVSGRAMMPPARSINPPIHARIASGVQWSPAKYCGIGGDSLTPGHSLDLSWTWMQTFLSDAIDQHAHDQVGTFVRRIEIVAALRCPPLPAS